MSRPLPRSRRRPTGRRACCFACPAAVLVDLDAVGHVQFFLSRIWPVEDSHHSTLAGEGAANLPVDDLRPRRASTSSERGFRTGASSSRSLQRLVMPSRQEGTRGRRSRRLAGACKDDAVLRGGARVRPASDAGVCRTSNPSRSPFPRRDSVHGDRKRETSLPPVRCDEAQEEQELLLDLHLSCTLVDEVDRSAPPSKATPKSAPTAETSRFTWPSDSARAAPARDVRSSRTYAWAAMISTPRSPRTRGVPPARPTSTNSRLRCGTPASGSHLCRVLR